MATTWSINEQQVHFPQSPRRTLHVLVVEDDPDCAACLALFLRLGGMAAEVAANGAAALSSLRASRPDVVLMDIGLPDMDGYQVARQLGDFVSKKPLLIALTGRAREEDRQSAADEGFDYHFVKPIDPLPLMALLNEYAASL
jgi:CheY-like chemotaxis protein